MSIDCGLVIEEPLFVGAVRHRHDVHVLKFRAGFAPVAMSENMVPPNFAAGLDFATGWHRPMKQRVETRDPNAGLRRFDVFKECRKASDNFARAQMFCHLIKFVQTDSRFFRARLPQIRTNFLRPEFAFQREQNVPFVLAKIDSLHPNHFCRFVRFLSRFDHFPSHVPDAKCENSFRPHDPEFFDADFLCEQFAMFFSEKPCGTLSVVQSLYSEPALTVSVERTTT